jgi:hypothetical protein
MGQTGPEWAARRPGCDVAAVDQDGRLLTTAGIEQARIG